LRAANAKRNKHYKENLSVKGQGETFGKIRGLRGMEQTKGNSGPEIFSAQQKNKHEIKYGEGT